MEKTSQSPGDSSRLPAGNVRSPKGQNPAEAERQFQQIGQHGKELRLLLAIQDAKQEKTFE